MKATRTILAALAVVALAACGSADLKQKTTPTTTAPASATPMTLFHPVTTTPMTVEDNASWLVSTRAAIAEWIPAITGVSDAANTEDVDAVTSACTAAGPSLDNLRDAVAQITVPTVQTPFQEGVRQYTLGLSACENGEMSSAATYIQEGNSYISQATSAMKAYTASR